MSKPLILHFVDAATDFEKLPETRAEVVFIGRSNVGKSSLLNAIGGKKNLAPVSQKPGRTKALGCFAIEMHRSKNLRGFICGRLGCSRVTPNATP